MYEFILWMCLTTQPECPVWNAYGNFVLILPTKTAPTVKQHGKHRSQSQTRTAKSRVTSASQ